nr:glycosyltransferase [Flavisolibacter sp.]
DQYYTSGGILQKSFIKVDMWRSQGHEVSFVIVYNDDQEKKIIQSFGKCVLIKRSGQKFLGEFRISRFFGKFPQHEKLLLKEIEKFHPDILYHRSFEISRFTNLITQKFRTVLEINGNQFGNLQSLSGNTFSKLLNEIRAAHLKLALKKFMQYHKGIVAVTHELLELYKSKSFLNDLKEKSIVIPNAISINSEGPRKVNSSKNKIQLVFLGSPNMKWHGIDLIIEIAKQTHYIFDFHIIGEQFPNHQILPANVHAHGYLSNEDYRKILVQSDIGIGTLSLAEAGIKEASPLKVREYADAGLPVIIGYKDTAFINHGVPEWALVLPSEKDKILSSVPAIIEYCRKMKNYIVSPEAVNKYFSIEAAERARLDFFGSLIQPPDKTNVEVATKSKVTGVAGI